MNFEDSCWYPDMIILDGSILQFTLQKSAVDCVIQCLANLRCGMASYDSGSAKCWSQNVNYWRLDATDSTATWKTARMDCVLGNYEETRESLCQNGNDLFQSLLSHTVQNHQTSIDQLVQQFLDVKNAYSLDVHKIKNETSAKNKRSWDAFEFISDIPVLGYFYDILKGPAENKKIKAHLQLLESRFKAFANAVISNTKSTRTFQQNVLEIIETELFSISKQIHGLKCDIASLSVILSYQQTLQHHIIKLGKMFFAPEHGRLRASIPQTLTLDDLVMVVKNNPSFVDTLYMEHPEVLYRMGELYMMQLSQGNSNLLFHFILIAPKLQLHNLHQTYTPIKVPIAPHSSQICFEPRIPSTILIKDKKFFSAETTDCTEKEVVLYCQQSFEDRFSPSLKEISCLSGENLDSCVLDEVECMPQMKFTKAGTLIFSESVILAMKRTETTTLEVVSQPLKWTYFFEWSMYQMVQTNQKVIYALDNELTTRRLQWESETKLLKFGEYLEHKSNEALNKNITHLKKIIDNTTDIIAEEFVSNYKGFGISKNKFQEVCSLASIVLTLLSIIGVIGMCCLKQIKKHTKLIRIAIQTVAGERQRERMQHELLRVADVTRDEVADVIRDEEHRRRTYTDANLPRIEPVNVCQVQAEVVPKKPARSAAPQKSVPLSRGVQTELPEQIVDLPPIPTVNLPPKDQAQTAREPSLSTKTYVMH